MTVRQNGSIQTSVLLVAWKKAFWAIAFLDSCGLEESPKEEVHDVLSGLQQGQ